ncbi:MAG: Na+ dependent nucleoside transporter protein [Phycisphaerales bacterium]|nr:Na+ dependent nucleoside transporter protein [Phycisphaerales bacterium]
MPNPLSGTLPQRLQCLLGLTAFVAVAWAVGRFRTRGQVRGPFPWRLLGWGLALQFAFAVLVLRVPNLLVVVTAAIDALLGYTRAGVAVVFGNLGEMTLPVTATGAAGEKPTGFAAAGAVFAFFVLPTIIFFSALTAIAYHLGVMQIVVQALAWVMSKTMKTSGAETLSAAANVFVGQTEAPLMVKPFVAALTKSELMCVMVAGFANIASGVLGLYTFWLKDYIDQAGGHLAAACLVSAPAALLVSKLMVPETETPVTAGGIEFRVERLDANLVDAATRGTTEGLGLALNVAAMLIAFTALVALVNGLLGWTGQVLHLTAAGQPPLSLQAILGYLLAPVAWLTGVSWADARTVGSLVGVKTVLNELIAYGDMKDGFAAAAAAGDAHRYLSPRSALIGLYALCGFANFASVGIQVGGISTLAPERRKDLSKLGLLAMFGGALASHMTAAVVGVLL